MSDMLSDAGWVAFVKKHKLSLDDGALLKALARVKKASGGKADEELAALDDAVEQVKKQVVALTKRKKEIGDKPFSEGKDTLYELLELAEKRQKQVNAAQQAADEEDSPALLTTKMIPLLRDIRKGDVTMQALLAVAGKQAVVLLSRNAISPARGKLLIGQLESPGGHKFLRGQCVWEQGAVTFVVDAPPAGLAKKIQVALLHQTQQRLKVRVRAEGSDEAEEEGESEGEQAPAGGAPNAAADPSMAGGGLESAMAQWQAERAKAITMLKSVAGKIAAARHPQSAKAIIEIQAVIKNMTALPTTAQQVSELHRYFDDDDVVRDVCELAFDIRTPLLKALQGLRAGAAA